MEKFVHIAVFPWVGKIFLAAFTNYRKEFAYFQDGINTFQSMHGMLKLIAKISIYLQKLLFPMTKTEGKHQVSLLNE